MDYSTGNTSMDITNYPNLHMKDHFVSQSYSDNRTIKIDGKNSNLEWGITTGMGGKWALQYRQFNPKGDNNFGEIIGMKTQEVNVLYKLNNNLSVFVGWHQAKYSYEYPTVPFSAENKDVLQGGIIGTTKIAPRTNLYGIVGIGKGLHNLESGISYEVDKHVELNFVYRYKKVEDIDDTSWGTNPYKDSVTALGAESVLHINSSYW